MPILAAIAAPLFADMAWAQIAIVVITLLIWLFNQISGAAKKGPPVQRPAAQPRPRPKPAAAGGRRQEVNDEVSEFLRRAAEKRAGGKPADVEIVRPEGRNEPRPDQRTAISRPVVDVVEVQEVDEVLARGSVAEHVQNHMDNREFEQRANQMTNVDQADDIMQAHMQQVFDHQLGSLGGLTQPVGQSGSDPEKTANVPTPAESIALLLANPQSMRGAVILNEILRRPEY
jgi:hypothetical protein